MKCPFCDHGNPEHALYCNGCGSPLNLKPCPQCAAVQGHAARFCHQCGCHFTQPDANYPHPATVPSIPAQAATPPPDIRQRPERIEPYISPEVIVAGETAIATAAAAVTESPVKLDTLLKELQEQVNEAREWQARSLSLAFEPRESAASVPSTTSHPPITQPAVPAVPMARTPAPGKSKRIAISGAVLLGALGGIGYYLSAVGTGQTPSSTASTARLEQFASELSEQNTRSASISSTFAADPILSQSAFANSTPPRDILPATAKTTAAQHSTGEKIRQTAAPGSHLRLVKKPMPRVKTDASASATSAENIQPPPAKSERTVTCTQSAAALGLCNSPNP